MHTKSIIALMLPLLLFATALPVVTAANTNETWFTAYSNALVAGKKYAVGSITLTMLDATTLEITVTAESGWTLAETHIHVAGTLAGIPQKNGNPIPGQFMDNVEHNPAVTTYTQTFTVSPGKIYIAIHAVVQGTVNCEPVEETAWGVRHCGCLYETLPFPGRNWAVYITYNP